jgi:hypothetical protein
MCFFFFFLQKYFKKNSTSDIQDTADAASTAALCQLPKFPYKSAVSQTTLKPSISVVSQRVSVRSVLCKVKILLSLLGRTLVGKIYIFYTIPYIIESKKIFHLTESNLIYAVGNMCDS